VIAASVATGNTEKGVAGVESEGPPSVSANQWLRGGVRRAIENPGVEVPRVGERLAGRVERSLGRFSLRSGRSGGGGIPGTG